MHASNFHPRISSEDLASLYQTIHSFTLFFIILAFLCCVGLLAVVIALIRISLAKQHEKESNEYASHVITAQEEERARISAELHDTVAQDLCVALSMAANENQRKILHDSIAQIRSLCYMLVPPSLTKQSLSSALKGFCLNFIDETKIDLHFLIREDAAALLDSEKFSAQQKLNIYRIVQESLMNVKKHANASEVSIFARRENKSENEGVYLFIEDDGNGFSQAKLAGNHMEKHFGLRGMNMRARQTGGVLTINSRTEGSEMGSGTEIQLFIPIGAFEK